MTPKNPVPASAKGTLSAREALLRIFQDLLAEARGVEEGILADRDPECLHDHRVALRKLRSLIAQVPGVFPKAVSAKWEKTLKDCCRATNTLRDLDVFLLEKKRLEKSLPAGLRGGLKPFFQETQRCRDIEARKVRRRLGAENHASQMARIESVWANPERIPGGSQAASPIGEVARKRLRRHFRKIRRIQKTMDGNTPDTALHKIRVECKQLRYLLECFGDLFRSEAVGPVLESLKKLQTRLGRCNDTAVQQAFLLNYARRQVSASDARQSLALGGLIGSLHQEHRRLRKKVLKSLHNFCRSDIAMDLALATARPQSTRRSR